MTVENTLNETAERICTRDTVWEDACRVSLELAKWHRNTCQDCTSKTVSREGRRIRSDMEPDPEGGLDMISLRDGFGWRAHDYFSFCKWVLGRDELHEFDAAFPEPGTHRDGAAEDWVTIENEKWAILSRAQCEVAICDESVEGWLNFLVESGKACRALDFEFKFVECERHAEESRRQLDEEVRRRPCPRCGAPGCRLDCRPKAWCWREGDEEPRDHFYERECDGECDGRFFPGECYGCFEDGLCPTYVSPLCVEGNVPSLEVKEYEGCRRYTGSDGSTITFGECVGCFYDTCAAYLARRPKYGQGCLYESDFYYELVRVGTICCGLCQTAGCEGDCDESYEAAILARDIKFLDALRGWETEADRWRRACDPESDPKYEAWRHLSPRELTDKVIELEEKRKALIKHPDPETQPPLLSDEEIQRRLAPYSAPAPA
ncbi:hypothetical protein [Nesterenkonia aerolata]|uniref:Uncharacterized protein n=1 Tax=Nesterenkonia aerolata TaxID=3074079 RepID=A0ABU2DRU9_9MICC|nr:hypothetical protein [Nesterenkonia sp. LY-0111]MDR8019235.1 hypothetical protein [Nesterenkonia sp. LY-0111]